METNLKKLLPMLGVMLTSFTLVQADDMDYQQNQTATKVNPAANQPSEDAYGAYIYADYLYWVVNEQSAVGVSGIFEGLGVSSADAYRGKTFYPKFEGINGFDVGLGMTFDHDAWDLYVEYTWLYKNNKNWHHVYSASEGEEGTAVATFLPYDLSFVDNIYTYWTYQFNNIDLDCGRDFFVGHYFTLRPHAGFKFAWTQKTLNNNYISGVEGEEGYSNFDSKGHQKFWGAGIRGGVDPTFYLNDNWQFFSTAAVAFPWTHMEVSQQVIDNTDEENPMTYVTPVIEGSFGLRWKVKFGDNDCYAFALNAAWEEQVWFNQNNWTIVDSIASPVTGGILTQQGLKVGLRFDF